VGILNLSKGGKVMPSFRITSPELNIRPLPNKENAPLGRLKEGAIVEKLGESGDWAFIRIGINTKDFKGDIVGWVSSKFFSPADQPIVTEKPVCPDEPFSIDSNLKERPSPLTAALIDKYLEEKDSPLAGIGSAVMATAQKYGINATYILAHAIHESGWGKSRISQEKHNLFGYGASDENPYGGAATFDSFADCIDFVMRKINANYLTEGGKFFEDEPSLGDQGDNDNKGYGMNVHYATDPGWAEKIATIAGKIEDWVKSQEKPAETQPISVIASPDPQRILAAVGRLNPEQDYYEPHDISGDGRPETFCNWFVADVLDLMGIKLPHYDESAGYCSPGNPIFPDGRCKPKSATELNTYFNQGGDGHWKDVDRNEAVSLSNQGNVVVASIPGHIGLVIPGGQGSEVHIAQAGARCGKDMLLEQGFGHADVEFFRYKA
jgi:hypothetical protein